jgi:uncharacterized protein with NAD-binding domain and iron-sulfur cluster
MPDKQRVVILGGGMASLTAAYELSSTPALRDRFSVTVYQRGWRLGGKCASSRGEHPAEVGSMRIEEHGLHVWFGFYFNAFHMMRSVYQQLHWSIDEMFERRDSTPLMEFIDGQWRVWPLEFLRGRSGEKPGVEPGIQTIPHACMRMMRFLQECLGLIAKGLAEADSVDAQQSIQWLRGVLASPGWMTDVHAMGRSTADKIRGFFGLSARRVAEANPYVTREQLALLDLMAWRGAHTPWHEVFETIARNGPVDAGARDQLRRWWILADLTGAVLRGLAKEAFNIAKNGLGVLDKHDLRRWLTDEPCLASPASLSAAPVRALYEVCFAYSDGDSGSFDTADFAAGAAVRCMLRITTGYTDAVCYTMKAGMGEAVIAPLYKVLRENGVRFEFFHKIDALELDKGNIAKVRFTRQATTKSDDEYVPIKFSHAGLAYWPKQPDFSQIVNGDDLSHHAAVDFESDMSPSWSGERLDVLDLALPRGGYATVILGISIGALKRITRVLDSPGSKWADMIKAVRTVATQAAQLWMTKTLDQLRYPLDKPPAMIAAPEPQDVWADMTSVIAAEKWRVPPASVQYICGPLKEREFSSRHDAWAEVEQNTAAWLPAMCMGEAWPGAAVDGAFDWNCLLANNGSSGRDRLKEQHLRANFEGSERYVLTGAGSTAFRLKADAMPAENLFLAGDWTDNGLNAGCVEAAVMSGMQAALAVRGEPIFTMSGATD